MKIRYYILSLFAVMVLITVSFPALVFASEPTEPETDNGLLDRLVHIVIPSDNFFKEEFEKLDTKLKGKLPFQTYIDTIGRLKEIPDSFDGDPTVLDFEFDYMGTPIKLEIGSMIAPHLSKIRTLVTGLYVLFIVHYNYRQIMHLIRGTNYGSMNTGSGGAASTEGEIHK